MDAYDLCRLPEETLVVCVASTTGDGEAPMAMRRFWAALRCRALPAGALHKVRYAVFGCGDSSYPKFNAVARRLDARLQQLGAKQLVSCGLGDDQAAFGVDTALNTWLPALFRALSPPGKGDDGIYSQDEIFRTIWGAGGAAHLHVCFRGGPSAAVLSLAKEVDAVRALARSDRIVLFSQVFHLVSLPFPFSLSITLMFFFLRVCLSLPVIYLCMWFLFFYMQAGQPRKQEALPWQLGRISVTACCQDVLQLLGYVAG
jgi:flavodoxin